MQPGRSWILLCVGCWLPPGDCPGGDARGGHSGGHQGHPRAGGREGACPAANTGRKELPARKPKAGPGGQGQDTDDADSGRSLARPGSDVLTPCAARFRRQVGNFLLGRAILALRNSLPYLMMGNLIRAEIRGCGDLTNRLNSEKPRLRRALSTFPGYPKLGQTPKLGSPRIVRVPEV